MSGHQEAHAQQDAIGAEKPIQPRVTPSSATNLEIEQNQTNNSQPLAERKNVVATEEVGVNQANQDLASGQQEAVQEVSSVQETVTKQAPNADDFLAHIGKKLMLKRSSRVANGLFLTFGLITLFLIWLFRFSSWLTSRACQLSLSF